MFRLSSLILLSLLLTALARAQTSPTTTRPAAAPQYRVILITLGPGDAIWEKFGHNMIDVRGVFDEEVSYHWGLFDFEQPGFVGNFIQGRMTYLMGAVRTQPTLEEYKQQNRHITLQALPLNQVDFVNLIRRCEINRQPANSQYKYDYFKQNCSTQVRDMLNDATGGRLKQVIDQQKPDRPMSYRQHALRLMQDELWLSLGIDFVLGPSCDRPLTPWEESFLPMQLAKYSAPMMEPMPPLWTDTRTPEYQNVPNRLPGFLIVGVLLAAAIVGLGTRGARWSRNIAGTLSVLWWLISGFGGLFCVYFWFFTDHTAAYANQNILHFSPLGWLMIVLLVVARRRAKRQAAIDGAAPVSSPPGGGLRRGRERDDATTKDSASRQAPSLTSSGGGGVDTSAVARATYDSRGLRLVAAIIVGVSLLGLLLKLATLLSQDNLRMILLALPLNLATAWWVWRLTRTPAADQVTASLSKELERS